MVPAESELAGSLYFHLRQNGFVNPLPSTKGALLTDEEYQDSLQRYIRSRGIVEDKQETWCRAGYTEFEEDTLVGTFPEKRTLRARRSGDRSLPVSQKETH